MQQLYIITSETHLKIGISVDPKKRLKELSTGSSTKIKIHRTLLPEFTKASELESKLHKRFKTYRCNGEWFSISCLEEVESALDGVDTNTIYASVCSKPIDTNLKEIEYCGTLYLNSEQTNELVSAIGANAVLVFTHYVAIAHQTNPDMSDDQIATLTGLSEQTVKRTRLALTKLGWFLVIKDKYKGQKKVTYLVGKTAVSQASRAVLSE